MAVQFNDILKAIQGAIDDFNSSIPASQKTMLNSVENSLRGLDLTSNGDIKISVANLKVIAQVKTKLQNLVVSDDYLQKVTDFVNTYSTISDLQNQYFTALESTFKPNALLKQLRIQSIADTVDGLTEAGIGATISQDISSILQTNITTGGSYKDLTDQLRVALTDQEGNPGLLSRYAGQITTDAINQYSANYMQTISSDLGFEWFAYTGADITTSRPFCLAMTEFNYFHVSEIPRLLAAKDLYYPDKKTGQMELVPIYTKTGLPQGMIEGTNPDNFQIRRGGYNCGHQIRPVFAAQVPPADRARVGK